MLTFEYSHLCPIKMTGKTVKNQSLTRRKPTQERAQAKIELILEAAIRIIDKDGLEGLSTNHIAAVAGISIGTLYQYFPDKAAIVDVLGQREMKIVTDKIIETISNPNNDARKEPARVLIDVVFGAFGGRSRVHRVLLENALLLGRSQSVDASPNLIASLLSTAGIPRNDGQPLRLSPAEAFVLTHAFTGVIRASVGPQAQEIPREEIKEELLRLIGNFVAQKNEAK
jgi:AcrR family transcriptional regulator